MALLNRKAADDAQTPAADGPAPLDLLAGQDPVEPDEMDSPAVAPEATAEAAPSSNPDDLLQMFAEGHDSGEDRSLLVGMVQDIGIAELLDDLQTLAASLNILRVEVEEDEALAA